MNKSIKIKLLSATIAIAITAPASAFNFGNFAQKMQEQMSNMQQPGAQSQNGMSNSKAMSVEKAVELSCKTIYGAPFKSKQLPSNDVEVVSQYLKTPSNLDEILLVDFDKAYSGSFTGFTSNLIPQFDNKFAEQLAEGYVREPGVRMFAQVIHAANSADKTDETDNDMNFVAPSDRSVAKTLLAYLLLQYKDSGILKDSNAAYQLLKKEDDRVKLASTMLARMHLYGDLAKQNFRAAFAHLSRGDGDITKFKLNAKTYADVLTNPPKGTPQSNINRLKQVAQSGKGLMDYVNKERKKAHGTAAYKEAQKLLAEGVKIDQITAEALGAGDKFADAKAKASLLIGEAKGEQDQLKYNVQVSEKTMAELEGVMNSGASMSEDSKKKFEEATQRRIKAHLKLNDLTPRIIATGMFQGAETAQLVNAYKRKSCSFLRRAKTFAKEAALKIEPPMSNEELADVTSDVSF